MKLLCRIIGHDAVGVPDIPWGVKCARCGRRGYFYEHWIDAGRFELGSQEYGKLSDSEKEAYNMGESE